MYVSLHKLAHLDLWSLSSPDSLDCIRVMSEVPSDAESCQIFVLKLLQHSLGFMLQWNHAER